MSNHVSRFVFFLCMGSAATGLMAASGQMNCVLNTPPAAASQMALSQNDIDGLRLMREEEKLALDVYQTLYAQWRLPIFANITRSEAQHSAAMQSLLKRYQLADPVAGMAAGQFANPKLQALYQQLIERGSQSPAAALQVGADIEDLDIADLRRLSASTQHADIRQVYGELERGSRNHLRSFVRQLRAQGITYQPQMLNAEDYQAIIASPMERGQQQQNCRPT